MTTVERARRVAVVTIELPFRPPYDWPRVLRFFAGRATPGVEAVEDGCYRRAIEWTDGSGVSNGNSNGNSNSNSNGNSNGPSNSNSNGNLNGNSTGNSTATSTGLSSGNSNSPPTGTLSGTLSVTRPPRRRCLVATIEGPVGVHAHALAPRIARMFDVAADPAEIGAHLAADAWLAPLVAAAPGLRVPGAWSAFELVVRAIVGQQVSVKAATTILGRLVARAGRRIDDHPHPGTAWRFPTPEALASVDLAGIGMPGRRVAALQGFAQAVASGAVAIEADAAQASAGDLDAMRAALLALPGIGPWTVEYVAMRAWRDANAWPATDLVLMQSIAARDPALVRATQQRARTDAWRPWRAYAAMHLWNEIADRAGAARGG